MAHEVDVAHRTRTDATRHARPLSRAAQAHAAPRWRVAGADAWQGPRESTRMLEGHHVASEGWQVKGPRVMGPGYRIWVVTHLCYAAPPYICDFSSISSVWDDVPLKIFFCR